MANLNKVMLIGNLTRDPEVRYTPKGTAVTDIGLAVNRNYTTDTGEKREDTTFVDITLWGRQAEIAGQYIKKGRPIFVEGRLQMDRWEDRDSGRMRSKIKVAGVVTHRQRPATAQGTMFINLEDETGLINIVVSKGCWLRFRDVARSATALLVRGRLERHEGVANVIAERLEPLSVPAALASRDFR